MTTALCGECNLWRPFPHPWGSHRSDHMGCGDACKHLAQPWLTHAARGRAFVFVNGGYHVESGTPMPVWCQTYKNMNICIFLKLEGNNRLLMMVMSGCVLKFPSLVFKYSTMSVNFYNWEILTFYILTLSQSSAVFNFSMIICSAPES